MHWLIFTEFCDTLIVYVIKVLKETHVAFFEIDTCHYGDGIF